MIGNFVALNDFIASIKEVEHFLTLAKNTTVVDDKMSYNKVSILLLAAKMEGFFEGIMEEYIYVMEQLTLTSERLPKRIKFSVAQNLLDENFHHCIKGKKETAIEVLGYLSKFFNNGCIVDEIKINKDFDFGKHGEKAIVELFQRIDVGNIFEECLVSPSDESLLDLNEQPFNVKGDVNAVVGYRNAIIHGDESPSSLTAEQIDKYKANIIGFARKIEEILKSKIGCFTE